MTLSRTAKRSSVINRLEAKHPPSPTPPVNDQVDIAPAPAPPHPLPVARPNRSKLSAFEKELFDAWAEC